MVIYLINGRAKIGCLCNNREYEVGISQAVYDDSQQPTKRYFLEKRWRDGENILGAILMNPSKATAVRGDKTIDALIDYAQEYNYDALYVVNIIPYICSNSNKLNDLSDEEIENMVREYQQKKFVEFLLTSSKKVVLGWGQKSQKYFKILIEDSEIKNNFEKFSGNCFTFVLNKSEKFPCHPFPGGIISKNYLSRPLVSIENKLKDWLDIREN